MRLAVLASGHDRPAALTLRLLVSRAVNAVGAGPLEGHQRDVAVRMVRRFGYRNLVVVRLLSRAG